MAVASYSRRKFNQDQLIRFTKPIQIRKKNSNQKNRSIDHCLTSTRYLFIVFKHSEKSIRNYYRYFIMIIFQFFLPKITR